MGVEIERKFLVTGDGWREGVSDSYEIVQGYLSTDPDCTMRIRIQDDVCELTLKGRAKDLVRPEFEYEIPEDDAHQILETFATKGHLIEKTRYKVPAGISVTSPHIWEVDVFSGVNEGLVVAELEFCHVGEAFLIPEWLGEEVTGDPRYFNSNLVDNPYQDW